MEYIHNSWKNAGYSEEEIEAAINGDGVVRKNGKIIPVRKHERPGWVHGGDIEGGKPLPVKFPNE